MQHRIIAQSEIIDSIQIIEIELINESLSERNSIMQMDESVLNYLTFNLNSLEILSQTPPRFVIKVFRT